MTEAVTLEIQDNLGLICIDYPPVNALGYAVRAGLVKALQEVGVKNKIPRQVQHM